VIGARAGGWIRPRHATALAVVLLTFLLAAVPAAWAGSASPALQRAADRDPARKVTVIAQFERTMEPAAAERLVRAAGGHVTDRLPIISGLAVRMRAGAAERLAVRAGVRAVSLNAPVEPQTITSRNLVPTYPASMGAKDSWGVYGVTGKGVGVAVIDTGIAGDLVDFRTSATDPTSRVVQTAVTNPYATDAKDGYGHGTHVAGIIAGNSTTRTTTSTLYGDYIGIAPEAHLVSVKADDGEGNATVLDVIYGLQFVVDHKADYNIRVVNLSLESAQAESYKTDPLDAAVEAAWFNGIVVVTAAGNRGTAAGAVTYAPGNDPYAIAVGAFDDVQTASAADDVLATFSSRGITQDGFAKPDIYASGVSIVSDLAPGSAFSTMCASCIVSGEYIRASGTSMSAPMVTGVVALLLQQYPQLTPDQVKAALIKYQRTLPGAVPAASIANLLSAGAELGNVAPTNQGLTPSTLIDPATGGIDYTRSSWSRSTWRSADGSNLDADFARSTWRCDCSTTSTGSIDPTRSTWRSISLSSTTWLGLPPKSTTTTTTKTRR
jgi:serine protease AprX